MRVIVHEDEFKVAQIEKGFDGVKKYLEGHLATITLVQFETGRLIFAVDEDAKLKGKPLTCSIDHEGKTIELYGKIVICRMSNEGECFGFKEDYAQGIVDNLFTKI